MSKEKMKKINKLLFIGVAVIFSIYSVFAIYKRSQEEVKPDLITMTQEVVEFTYQYTEGDYQFKKIGEDTAYISIREGDIPSHPSDFEDLATSNNLTVNLTQRPYIDNVGDYYWEKNAIEKHIVQFDVQNIGELKVYLNPKKLDVYYENLEVEMSVADHKVSYYLHDELKDTDDFKVVSIDPFIFKNEQGKHAFHFLARPKFELSEAYLDKINKGREYSIFNNSASLISDDTWRYVCIEDEGCYEVEGDEIVIKHLENKGFKKEETFQNNQLNDFITDFNRNDKVGMLLKDIDILARGSGYLEFIGTKEEFSQHQYFEEYVDEFTDFKDEAKVQIMIAGHDNPFGKLLEIFKATNQNLEPLDLTSQDFENSQSCETRIETIENYETLSDFYDEQEACWVSKLK